MSQPDQGSAKETRRLLLGSAIAAIVLFVLFTAWPLITPNPVGTPPGGVNPAKTSDATGSGVAPAQNSAESTVGKNDSSGQEDSTGARARAIKQTSRALQLSESQHQQLRDIIGHQPNPPRLSRADFELMIGASVPQQIQLQNLPPEIAKVMDGYSGDQYVLVRDKMVIVDQHSRRVVAIVPNVT